MLGPQGRLDRLGLLEARGHQGLQVTEAIKDQQERPERQEVRVFPDPRDLQEIVVNQDQPVMQE